MSQLQVWGVLREHSGDQALPAIVTDNGLQWNEILKFATIDSQTWFGDRSDIVVVVVVTPPKLRILLNTTDFTPATPTAQMSLEFASLFVFASYKERDHALGGPTSRDSAMLVLRYPIFSRYCLREVSTPPYWCDTPP